MTKQIVAFRNFEKRVKTFVCFPFTLYKNARKFCKLNVVREKKLFPSLVLRVRYSASIYGGFAAVQVCWKPGNAASHDEPTARTEKPTQLNIL
jgi:hypothetical protein